MMHARLTYFPFRPPVRQCRSARLVVATTPTVVTGEGSNVYLVLYAYDNLFFVFRLLLYRGRFCCLCNMHVF